MSTDDGPVRATYTPERLGALSDGVFAIVMTLLVLELKIPEMPDGFSEQRLHEDLAHQIPNFLAWLISFVLLARFWIVHHAIVATLARCHTGTMVWNFVVLGLVSLVPFGAGLIGTYEFDPLALIIFATLLGSTGLALGLFARHALGDPSLHRTAPHADTRWHATYQWRVLPAFAVVSMALLPVAEVVALAVWVAEPLVAFASFHSRHR